MSGTSIIAKISMSLRYSSSPNGATLYTEKSHTFKNDGNPFLSFLYYIMTGRLSVKSTTPNFVFVVGDVLQIYCHIGSGMPYLYIFVEEVVAFLGTMTNKWV